MPSGRSLTRRGAILLAIITANCVASPGQPASTRQCSSAELSKEEGRAGASRPTPNRLDPLVTHLWVTPDTNSRTASVRFDLSIRNPTETRRSLITGGSGEQQIEFVVLDSAHRQMWNSVEGQSIDLVRNEYVLAPGDSVLFSSSWVLPSFPRKPIPPQDFRVRAYATLRQTGDSPISCGLFRVH